MALSWFEHLIYGLISGFAEFLPISAVAHQAIFTTLVGGADYPWLRLSCHIGSLMSLLVVLMPILSRMRRERKMARSPRRRNRQPDIGTMMEIRVFYTTAISMLPVFLCYGWVYNLYERLWLLAILLGVNGILLYVPQFLPSANKRAESMSGLDGMLIGLSGGLGVVPGFSRVGLAASTALVQGVDRQYAADIALLISIPALLIFGVLDVIAGIGAAAAISGSMIFGCITAGAASAVAAYFSIFLVRFLAVKAGFSGFSYYCWGLALFSLIIYLI